MAAAGPWGYFEASLAGWVRTFVRPGLEFCGGHTSIPGFPPNSFRADALLTNGRSLLAVEVEVRQKHPDTNVGKYWLLAQHHRYESVLLFHIYTPSFNSYGWRMKLGKFYAERMANELPFEYVLIDARGKNDVNATLAEVKGIVEPRINAMFNIRAT